MLDLNRRHFLGTDGGEVRERPSGPGDLPDHQGLPVRLVDEGAPIEELF